MFGIIDENKKFILLDNDYSKLRMTALGLLKDGVSMFNEDTVDEAITEYADEDIETTYDGKNYVKGYVPAPTQEAQRAARERAFVEEADPLRYAYEEDVARYGADSEQALASKEVWLAKKDEIRQHYPYPVGE